MLTVNLKALLRRYVEGDELGFRVCPSCRGCRAQCNEHTDGSGACRLAVCSAGGRRRHATGAFGSQVGNGCPQRLP